MQITLNTKVAAIIGGTIAVAAVSIGGYAVHKSSVHEQNCLSYEKQMDSHLNEGVSFIDELATMKRNVDSNPFMAFAYLNKIGEVETRSLAFRKKMNDTNYAYRETCGLDRGRKFVESPENKTRLDHIINVAGSL